MIEKGRYGDIPGEYRTCFYCKSPVEDELHFEIICPLYTHLRIQFLPAYVLNQSSSEQFYTIMSSQNETTEKYINVHLLCIKSKTELYRQFA